MPDDIFPRQVEHFRVDSFHRQRARIDHKGRIAQGSIEGVVFDVDQTAHFWQTGDIQTRFGDKGQRAFRAGQNAGQVELAEIVIEDVAQIVPGQETVQFREFIQNQLAIIATAVEHAAIDAPDRRVVLPEGFGQLYRHRLSIENVAPQKNRAHAQHVIGGFTVHQRPLPGGIGVNHPAKCRPVAGG
ncbi:hypothetical protein D3C71_1212290 [compost metagenome]